jgi:UDP-2,3-diacylglucosamine pyrophosphatase LpxH
MDWHEEALRLYGTLDNDGNVMGYKRVAKAVNQSDKTVESYIRRNKQTNNIQPIQKEIDVQTELIKDLQKQSSRSFLCDKYKVSDRILSAYIEDIRDKGYQVLDDLKYGQVMICKDVVPNNNQYNANWNGNKIIRFGLMGDTQINSKYTQLTHLHSLYDIYADEEITDVYHTGDIDEGEEMRIGHKYECYTQGADDHVKEIVKTYPEREGITTHFITGNHDASIIKRCGYDIGYAIQGQRKDMHYLGNSEALVYLTPNCTMQLSHPLDGTAYAISYKTQKMIDAMSGGEKPNILAIGHYHKAEYIFYRNVHAFQTGCFQAQTPFMKGKGLAAMLGGYIVEIHVDSEGTINRIKSEFIPFYKAIKDDYLNWR